MTDSTQPDAPFDDNAEGVVQPEIPGAVEAVTPPKGRRTKAQREADEMAAAEAAEAAAVVANKATGGQYLPSLPEGYAYTHLEITGPDDATLVVGASQEGFGLTLCADGLDRQIPYPTFDAAIKGAAQGAKNLVKRAARKAELAALEAEFEV